ncbi:GerMN domain-containing protein [Treponema pedis]|uniref:GerMN domain-containing protein n=1 Tax=Treponema pedis TaxID=409322 RepID=A0A7S7AYB6_9SPIR|nr:GerMN domain-containing protein [Treponema pedis]QOW61966.1 GerMN domain-containing protein [Treponema pedis]QSI04886.1 hypothetical protein DYQ05_08075 [Treponema pedis]
MSDKNNKRASLGWFFWVAFILLVALLFFINKNNIRSVLEKTNAKKIFQKTEKEELNTEADLMEIQNEIEKITAETQGDGSAYKDEPETAETSNTSTDADTTDKSKVKKTEKNPQGNILKTETAKKTENITKTQEKNVKTKPVSTSKQESPVKEQNFKPKTEDKSRQTESRSVFFVQVEADGKIVRKQVIRQIPKTDSPMTETLKVLLKGTSNEEAKNGLRSFIPPETKLLSAYVKNGTAFINLSEEFQFNRYGIEAYYAQLAQIVFTACEFSTVENVRFLIEGRQKEYLGGEGVWIGSPFSKNSF